MQKTRHKALFLLATTVITVIWIESISADLDPCDEKRSATTRALDEVTWNQLNAIYQEISEEDYDDAVADLEKLLRRADRDTYLRAIVNQALAQVEWSRGEYESSLSYLEEAVSLDILPDQAHFALLYQLAQLYYMQERYTLALERLSLWFCKVPPESITPPAHVFQASLFSQQEDYQKALNSIDAAIALADDPRESWYQLKLAAHYELEQFPQAAQALEVMIEKWPERKIYWIQLSQIQFRLKREQESLAVLALAHRKGLLDNQADVLYLSSLYSISDLPYQAADVLQTGIRDGIVESSKQRWATVAELWYAAHELEKALAAYELAGRAADDGVIDLRRGFILVDLERWPAALESLDLALNKGGLGDRKMGEAYLLRGMAQFNLGNLDDAGVDWDRAGQYEHSREAARQWLNQLSNP